MPPKAILSGHFEPTAVAGVRIPAFVPAPLPPAGLRLDADIRKVLDQALAALGALEGAAKALPASDWLLYSFVRREAVLTSQIEGTRSSLAETLAFESGAELPGTQHEDLSETARAVVAMEHGLKRLRGDLPLSVRLLKEMHERLMGPGPKGSLAAAGELRRSQNWIGGASPDKAAFVPPPPHRVGECLSQWERYLHQDETHGLVVKAALVHAQFESIHPFLDGNGRLGRQLVTLLLMQEGVLSGPWLWLSLAVKRRQDHYYKALNATRQREGWAPWVRFFAECVLESAQDSLATALALEALVRKDHDRIVDHGARQTSCLMLHEALCRRPVLSVKEACRQADLVPNAVANAVRIMEKLGLLRELSGRKRDRVYVYAPFMKVLEG